MRFMNISKKPERIQNIFSSVAHRYDLTNDVLSLGTHRLWKNRLLDHTVGTRSTSLLDLATGTGDVAFAAEKKYPQLKVTGLDLNAAMLARAEQKKTRLNSSVEFIQGDVLKLPFADNSFDAITFAFGIRNVSCVDKALKEIRRVLKPHGSLGILEFGKAQKQTLITKGFALYQSHLLPVIGGLLTGDSDAYRYLDASSKNFASGPDFVAKMQAAGFDQTRYEDLSMAYIYLSSGQAETATADRQ
jgi:demethylmenaquinone methyltransferase / 2-methoxy-6-polyprenyl-1,4-benzoquinol methylase